VHADVSWMDMRAWDKCVDPARDIEAFAGQRCWIGLDLASKTDIAAMVVLFAHPEIEGGYAVFGRYMLPEETALAAGTSQYPGWLRTGRLTATPGNVIDFGWIETELLNLASRFQIRALRLIHSTQRSSRPE
jgi:phage terminase large subunit-like protein